jgi:hypothetical protein
MDDLLDARVEIATDGIDVLGYVVWGNGATTTQWMDPLWAHFVRNGTGEIIRYTPLFCDERRPTQPYKAHRRFEPSRDLGWCYSGDGRHRCLTRVPAGWQKEPAPKPNSSIDDFGEPCKLFYHVDRFFS